MRRGEKNQYWKKSETQETKWMRPMENLMNSEEQEMKIFEKLVSKINQFKLQEDCKSRSCTFYTTWKVILDEKVQKSMPMKNLESCHSQTLNKKDFTGRYSMNIGIQAYRRSEDLGVLDSKV